MRHWLLVVSLLAPVTAFAAPIRGAWHLSQNEAGGLQLEMTHDSNHMSHSIGVDAFRGLTAAVITAAVETPAHFQLVRDAGTFDYSGTFLNGDGVGRFTFTPDATYADRLRALDVPATDLNDDRLYSLAVLDVTIGFIREMQSLGYREALDRYVAFRIHGATPQYVREVRDLSVTGVDAEHLVALRIHGATTDYIRDLGTLGYRNLAADDLVRMRIHGVTPEYIRGLAESGYRDVPADKLVQLRIHGASIEYVRQLATLGYRNLSSDQLVEMRIHGVTPEYIRELAAAGYHDIPVEKLVSMRIHGIDADFIGKAR